MKIRAGIRAVAAIILLVVGGGGYIYFGTFESTLLGNFESAGTSGLLRVVLGFMLTLIGTALGTAHRALSKLKDGGANEIDNISVFLASVARSVDLWIGFSVSPIVFALLLSSTNGVAISAFCVIALQNGFFCHAVIERVREKA